jgi:RNA polymerase sigma-70 factor (ECF subfamily)
MQHDPGDRSPTDVTTYEDADDQRLWDEASHGSGAAFGLLFDRHARAVYNHCFRLTGSWANADDHVQTTFLLAWRKRDAVQLRNSSALPWLLAIATNVVRSEGRSIRRRLRLVSRLGSAEAATSTVADHADAVAARLDDEQRMAEILPAIRSLPRAEREAVALCLWSGVSYSDAAAVLGIAESSVRARVSRARSRLAEPPAPAFAPTSRVEEYR